MSYIIFYIICLYVILAITHSILYIVWPVIRLRLQVENTWEQHFRLEHRHHPQLRLHVGLFCCVCSFLSALHALRPIEGTCWAVIAQAWQTAPVGHSLTLLNSISWAQQVLPGPIKLHTRIVSAAWIAHGSWRFMNHHIGHLEYWVQGSCCILLIPSFLNSLHT